MPRRNSSRSKRQRSRAARPAARRRGRETYVLEAPYLSPHDVHEKAKQLICPRCDAGPEQACEGRHLQPYHPQRYDEARRLLALYGEQA
jgi:hypothetical protein